MKKKYLFFPGTTMFVILTLLSFSSLSMADSTPTLTSGPLQGDFSTVVAPTATVLWDQPATDLGNVWVDQVFPDSPTYSSFLADDFINAMPWLIEDIYVPGNLWNGATDLNLVTSLTWQIYADNGGVPDGDPSGGGNPPVWTLTLPPNDPQVTITNGVSGYPSNTSLNLTSPVILPPGHWWLVFYPTKEFTTWGQYGRHKSDTTNGITGQFINPGNGFGFGTAWQDWTILHGGGHADIAFRLEGNTKPDLVVSYLDGVLTIKSGVVVLQYLARYRVMNLGVAAPPTKLAFYLSMNATLDPGDFYIGSVNVPALAHGQEWPLPNGLFFTPYFFKDKVPHTWFVIAKADANNEVDESNENNNVTVDVPTITGR